MRIARTAGLGRLGSCCAIEIIELDDQSGRYPRSLIYRLSIVRRPLYHVPNTLLALRLSEYCVEVDDQKTKRRAQQGRTRTRQARSMLQLLPMRPQGQGYQAIHCPKHG